MRIILTGAVLCAFASTAFAADHYVELWNPPEARTATHASASASASGKKAAAKRSKQKRHLASAQRLATRRVAEPAMRASATLVPADRGAPTPSTVRHPLIAPKLGPDGHIMTVGYRV